MYSLNIMRTYKKKTNKGSYSKELIEEAVRRVMYNKKSIRSVALELKICHLTLWRYVNKAKKNASNLSEQANVFDSVGYARKAVFSVQESKNLSEYIKHASKIYFGLTPKEVRKFAFECAVAFNKFIPLSWTKNQTAGPDWLTIFFKSHQDLSIRTPEQTSLGRATSFNRNNVAEFFNKLADVRDQYNFSASDIWNVDETGVTTVQRLGKVLSEKGVKQVGGITSSERGVLVTLCTAVSATGNSVPPMFIFPRKRYQNHFIRDGPNGSVGVGNKSGWMTTEEFYNFMQHFITNVRPSRERPVLLLLDNHESHLSVKTINLAKENGVVMLSFPPHCSHRLQPLDRSVYGPFKKYLSSAQYSWLRTNPGKSMTIYDVPKLVSYALPKALTPNNITNGFQAAGIEPFNRDVFTDDDYLPASVTDRPMNLSSDNDIFTEAISRDSHSNAATSSSTCVSFSKTIGTNALHLPVPESQSLLNSEEVTYASPFEEIIASSEFNETLVLALEQPIIFEFIDTTMAASEDTAIETSVVNESTFNETDPGTTSSKNVFCPQLIRPYPKAGPRKQSTTGRKKRKTAILTSTPEKDALALEQSSKAKRQLSISVNKKQAVRKKLTKEPDDWFCLVCTDAYSRSKPGEFWVMCIKCKKWAHEKCTPNKDLSFICHNC